MEDLTETRKLNTCPPDRPTDQGLHTTDCQVSHTEATHVQPLDLTWRRLEDPKNYLSSSAGSYQRDCGQLPPVSTFLNRETPEGASAGVPGTPAGGGWTETSGSHQAGAASENFTQTSPPRPSTGSLTTEALWTLQFSQVEKGHIKRPMNAFMVWSHIHRSTLKEQNPGANMMYIAKQLGIEWSKLTEEQKRPYFESAYKLKQMHQKKFPDYEFCPKKRRNINSPSSGQRAEQRLSSVPQMSPPAQSDFQGTIMDTRPATGPYTPGYYHYPSFYQYIPIGLYSSTPIQCAVYPNACSPEKEIGNHYHRLPQREERNQARDASRFMQPRTAHICHDGVHSSTATLESIQRTDTLSDHQLIANNQVEDSGLAK